MTPRKDWSRKQTQVVLRDIEPWIQQLHETFRVRCELTAVLPAPGDGIKHGVYLRAYYVEGNGVRRDIHEDWDIIDDCTTGAIERAGIKMISKLLLSLENDLERLERERQLPLWRA